MKPGMKTQRLKAWSKRSKIPKRLNPAYKGKNNMNKTEIPIISKELKP